MGLDILSQRGRETLGQELRAVEIIQNQWPQCEYYHTPKIGSAAVDAIIIRPPEIVAVCETKCRQCSLSTLRNEFNNEWLVTAHKMDHGKQAAELLGIEFWGILYLVPDDIVLRIKLWRGDWLVPIEYRQTATQSTVNGGIAHRINAFIPMESADIIRPKQ